MRRFIGKLKKNNVKRTCCVLFFLLLPSVLLWMKYLQYSHRVLLRFPYECFFVWFTRQINYCFYYISPAIVFSFCFFLFLICEHWNDYRKSVFSNKAKKKKNHKNDDWEKNKTFEKQFIFDTDESVLLIRTNYHLQYCICVLNLIDENFYFEDDVATDFFFDLAKKNAKCESVGRCIVCYRWKFLNWIVYRIH